MSGRTYTEIPMGGGHVVTVCNDCGAYVTDEHHTKVQHFEDCTPTDMIQFEEEDDEHLL